VNEGAPFKGLKVKPADSELARRQWADWRSSRRGLIKIGAFGGSAVAAAGLFGSAKPILRVASAQEEPKYGGSISMSMADSDATSWDPPVPPDNMSIWQMLLFYEQLLRVAPDGNTVEPALATEWSVSDDGLHYTFNLREGVKFHDGTDFTSADVKHCLERAAHDETAWQFILSVIDTVDTPDPLTAVVNLSSVWAPFEADVAIFAASIFPKAAHEAQGAEFFDQPIGTGPFMFESWERDVQITMVKNPNYWDPSRPYLDNLLFKVLPDSNARMLQFQGGELDIVTLVPPNQLEAITSNSDYKLIENTVARIDYIGINVRREPFNDKALRQAINYAVNKQAIIDNVMFGAAEMATSFLPKMAGRDPNSPGYPYDLAKAQELVAQSAGANGFSGTLWIGAGNAVDAQVAQLVVSDLAQIGGNIEVAQEEGTAFLDRIFSTFDFDMYMGYFTTDIIDPDELAGFAVLFDGGVESVGTGYNNPEVNQLVKDGQVELDPAKRQEIYNRIQAIHLDDAPFLFLFYPTGRTAVRSYVQNFNILPTGNYRLYDVWRSDV
jgi:peptide/nickel transport system substrate-binding protein